MKVVKKYQVLKIVRTKVDDEETVAYQVPRDAYWAVGAKYDTKKDAVEAAFKFSKWLDFTIMTHYSFNNY